MALTPRSTKASIDTTSAIQSGNKVPLVPGMPKVAGEALDPAAPCYIKSSDGKVYMANGTADDEAAEVVGWTPKAYVAGEPVTLFRENSLFYYSDDFSGDGVSPGDKLYVGATAGRLDKAATTGDASGVAVVWDNHHILVTRASF